MHGERKTREENCVSSSWFSFKSRLAHMQPGEAEGIAQRGTPAATELYREAGAQAGLDTGSWVMVSSSDSLTNCLLFCLRRHGVNPHILKPTPILPPSAPFCPIFHWALVIPLYFGTELCSRVSLLYWYNVHSCNQNICSPIFSQITWDLLLPLRSQSHSFPGFYI